MDDLLAHVTPTWLTDILRRRGHLSQGQVTRINQSHAIELLYSKHMHIVADYSPDAPSTAPTHLFLKTPKPHARLAAQREITFYTMIAPRVPSMPVVPYYASGTLGTDTPFILLLDVSPTHHVWNNGLLSHTYLDAIMTLLAQIHSDWWQSPYLNEFFPNRSEAVIADLFSAAQSRYDELVDQLGEQLTAEHRQIFERYLACAPTLFQERLDTCIGLTLCHPDNHHANFLFPRNSVGPIYVIDWHVYRRWWSLIDIVALITRSVPLDQRDQPDKLLHSYHRKLIHCGVTDYSWESCWYDYRLSVIDTLRVILSFSKSPERALQNLGPIMQEFQRCHCAELLC